MIRQTAALFLDAYRELNARKLFWVVLVISALGVGAFAGVGLDDTGVKILWFRTIPTDVINTRFISADTYYKFVFATVGVSFWLSWIAGIMALVSTASIFPDFVAGGSIELLLSKPIGRVRLFLTKFCTGLLFTVIQVGVFSLACFLVIGIRGKSWTPEVFWAIPFVTATFSYLFCVCALLGLLTRSTIASLMLTILFWFAIFGVDATEKALLQVRENNALELEDAERRLASVETRAGKGAAVSPAETRPAGASSAAGTTDEDDGAASDAAVGPDAPRDPGPQSENGAQDAADDKGATPEVVAARQKVDEARESYQTFKRWHSYFYAAKTLCPKTAETEQLLKRHLLTDNQLALFMNPGQKELQQPQGRKNVPRAVRERIDRATKAAQRVQAEINSRSTAWVMGTSLTFEAGVLALGAFIFRRRDF